MFRSPKLLTLTFTLACAGALTAQDSSRPRTLDEVVVTGQFRAQSLKQSVFKVRVINSERIRTRGATGIPDVLNTEMGIRLTTDYTLGETDVNLMGMSGQNVKILMDGIPLVDRGSTRQSLSQIDINNVERIEIVEGPMSVIYGTDALAGVINIISRKSTTSQNQLEVAGGFQEESTGNKYAAFINSGIHNENLRIRLQQNKWSLAGSFSRNSFGGWTGNAALRAQEAKPKDQYLAGINIGYRTERSAINYKLDFLNEDIYAAGALNTNNYRAKDQHYLTDRLMHLLSHEYKFNTRFILNTSASYQDYERKTDTYTMDYRAGTKTASTDPGELDVSKFNNYFLRSTAHWLVSEKLSFQPGIEIKNEGTSGQRIAGTPSISDYSAFVSAEWKTLPSLTFKPGLRFSKNSIYDAPPVIPSLNAKYDIDEQTSLRASYAHGFRAPALRELYFNYFDANHSIQGNPSLKAETSDSYQASVSRQFINKPEISFNTSVSAFYNDFKNRISLAAAPNNIFSYFNIDRYKTQGATIENNFHWKNFSAIVNLAYVGRYNRYVNEVFVNKRDANAFTWSPELNANLSLKVPKAGATVSLFYKWTGKLPTYSTEVNANGQTELYLANISGYHWADLTISKKIFKIITIQGGLKNILDVKRISNTSADAGSAHTTGGPILVGYGRSFFFGANFQWVHKR